jgi:endonuclease YncB( thermonuclease family)
MPYTLLAGEFVIRYPDLPRQGPQPDGDTVKFAPDTPALVDDLPRPSGGEPDINQRGISVRLEAIDALETHFNGAHQELDGANAARDALLSALGFTGVTFFADAPNNVESADQDRVRGHVLSNGIDANGRLIGFVEPGDATEPDGMQIFLDDTRARGTVNAALLAGGLVYPALYSTLPASLRAEFAQTARQARAAGLGIWPRATADPDGPAQVAGLQQLETLVIWPKLFRRLVPYLATGATTFDGFGAWLQEDPVNRDDEIVLTGRTEPQRLHDVVDAAGDHVQLTAWPEDFVITPDPPAQT